MRLWPRSLLSRLLIIVLGGLLLANTHAGKPAD